MQEIINSLLNSPEPSIRNKILVNVLKKNLLSPEIRSLQNEIRNSARVKTLLLKRNRKGIFPYHPYAKWYGAHYTLSILAEIDYPPGDKSLFPLIEQALTMYFPQEYFCTQREQKIPTRIHACIPGNTIYYALKLGYDDKRIDRLMEVILENRWPDGGWNCDLGATGKTSSFEETLIPLRALSLYSKIKNNSEVKKICIETAEVFLKRKLYKRVKDGKVMRDRFTLLHYPTYYQYDILFGLKIMTETGFIKDKRCSDALDLLESKRLDDGGFPAEQRFYNTSVNAVSQYSPVNWGGTSKRKMNEWVTADALFVLKESGRI
jgi:hypothetical protein